MLDKHALRFIENRIQEQCNILAGIRTSLDDKISIRSVRTLTGIAVTLLIVSIGSLYNQGKATYAKISSVDTRVSVLETRLDAMKELLK